MVEAGGIEPHFRYTGHGLTAAVTKTWPIFRQIFNNKPCISLPVPNPKALMILSIWE